MVRNDANLDILQLVSRLSGTTEVANILAKYPQWDRCPHQLRLPGMSHESKEIPDKMDEQSFTVPGCLIQSVNPTTLKTHLSVPFYLLQSMDLVTLTASL